MFRQAVLFSGGGTGGHIFPALAIAEALRRRESGVRCCFVCSDRAIDSRILSQAGADFVASAARPFSVRPGGLWRFCAGWGPSVRQSRGMLRGSAGEGRARALIAMGGFVAAPSVQAARAERTPTVLVNLDAIPGKANRWCARHADAVLTACDSASIPASWTRIGPIVRPEARATTPRAHARASFGLDPDRFTLLVTGGSQGARSINRFVAAFAAANADVLGERQILHQCGEGEGDSVRAAYDDAGVRAMVVEFIDRVGDAWAAADVCVARSGAGTVAEAWANRVPCLFLPYPYHRDEHQRHNAAPLVDAGGARLAADLIDADRNLESVGPLLLELVTSEASGAAMRGALEALGPADGAEGVAGVVSDLVSGPR